MSRVAPQTGDAGAIVIVPAPDGAWIVFAGMARPPKPILRWVPSMDAARTFAIAMHQSHGWPIKEGYSGGAAVAT